jgi:DNA-directed RNA polymerase subunit beta
VKTYEAIVKGENIPEPGVPESFKVLIKEMQSLSLDVKVLGDAGREIQLRESVDDDITGLEVNIEGVEMDTSGEKRPVAKKRTEEDFSDISFDELDVPELEDIGDIDIDEDIDKVADSKNGEDLDDFGDDDSDDDDDFSDIDLESLDTLIDAEAEEADAEDGLFDDYDDNDEDNDK